MAKLGVPDLPTSHPVASRRGHLPPGPSDNRQADAGEDESADPVGDGHCDADLAARLPAWPGRHQPDTRLPSPPACRPGLPIDGAPLAAEDHCSGPLSGGDSPARRRY